MWSIHWGLRKEYWEQMDSVQSLRVEVSKCVVLKNLQSKKVHDEDVSVLTKHCN